MIILMIGKEKSFKNILNEFSNVVYVNFTNVKNREDFANAVKGIAHYQKITGKGLDRVSEVQLIGIDKIIDYLQDKDDFEYFTAMVNKLSLITNVTIAINKMSIKLAFGFLSKIQVKFIVTSNPFDIKIAQEFISPGILPMPIDKYYSLISSTYEGNLTSILDQSIGCFNEVRNYVEVLAKNFAEVKCKEIDKWQSETFFKDYQDAEKDKYFDSIKSHKDFRIIYPNRKLS